MHLGGLLSTQEARVALGYRLVRLLLSCLATITPWLHAARKMYAACETCLLIAEADRVLCHLIMF